MKNTKRLLLISMIVLLILLSHMILFGKYQYEYFERQPEQPTAEDQNYNNTNQSTPQLDSKRFLEMPAFFWPRIMIFGSPSAVVVYVALIFGISMYVIGYRAGGRLNRGSIITAITLTTLVAVFGRSFILWLQIFLYKFLFSVTDSSPVAASLAEAIVYVVWVIFIAGISVNLYETFTVTMKEAHPMGG